MGATPHKAVTSRFPQVGGNRNSEAPGVIFDPTTKGEGMESPPPNDSLTASLSQPVGGRLGSFRRDWQTNVHQTYKILSPMATYCRSSQNQVWSDSL